jgi:hypothetical protein
MRSRKVRKMALELGPGETPVLKRGIMLDTEPHIIRQVKRRLGEKAHYILADYTKGMSGRRKPCQPAFTR